MRRLLRFARAYKLLSFVVATGVVGLVLELAQLHGLAHFIIGAVSIICVFPLLTSMWQDFRSGTYGIDILAVTAIIASVILHQYWAALVVLLMLTGGEALEAFAERRAKTELEALLERAPQKATVLKKGKHIEVLASEVHPGDKVIIKAGEIVPTDGAILEGIASFDESSLTGEALPQAKQIGDQVLSGSVNIDGPVTVKATATASDSQYQQIVKLVRGAAGSQAPFVRLADRYSLPFTFTAFAIAIAVWVLSGQAIRFLEVIIVATPCPLILAAPIALVSGMARASRYGIIVKSGAAFERLAEAETFAFDKTGTLTTGQLRVTKMTAFGSHTQTEVLSLAASLEQSSNHVVAQAIVDGAASRGVKSPKAKHIQEFAGRGLKGSVKSQEIIVGRLSLLEEHGVHLPAKFKPADVNQTAVFVAAGGEMAGFILLGDELRSESKAMLHSIKRLGIKHTLLITGDNSTVARQVAKQLAIEDVHADALPADKLRVLSGIKQRPVAFVGDGVNDAPILTAADIGIALGARGSTAASESADLVILPDDIGHVATALRVAKRTFTIAQQSIIVGILLSLLLMAAFATGKFSPLLGAVLQEIVDVVVIFNALRAHRITVS